MSQDTAQDNDTATAAQDDEWFAEWRSRELSRVDASGTVYLDYTGSALYPESLVRADARRLEQTVLGNPHSEHGPSRAATNDLNCARRAILDFLRASPDEYTVIITPNASAACRLVGESFPFVEGSRLALSADNHNSVNGLREFARARGAEVLTIGLDDALRLRNPLDALSRQPPNHASRVSRHSLFGFPAQSNFSGVRHPLTLIIEAQKRGWRVLLDAASFVPSADLRLDEVRPDFVALSIYKIAGYPSGIGALVARREALAELVRPWFAGGTVHWVSVQNGTHRFAPDAQAFEDGTPPFLAAGAVASALGVVRDAGRERLARHLSHLTSLALRELAALTHGNGRPLVRIHGPLEDVFRGATIALSLYDSHGRVIPYWTVEEDARRHGIAVRGGCFCNPGCAEAAFYFPAAQTRQCLDDLGDTFTIPRFSGCLGDRAVGAVRVSLGLGSVHADVARLLDFLGAYADSDARSHVSCRR